MPETQKSPQPRSPFTVRLSPDERALLTRWASAAGLYDGEYARHQLFGVDRTIRGREAEIRSRINKPSGSL